MRQSFPKGTSTKNPDYLLLLLDALMIWKGIPAIICVFALLAALSEPFRKALLGLLIILGALGGIFGFWSTISLMTQSKEQRAGSLFNTHPAVTLVCVALFLLSLIAGIGGLLDSVDSGSSRGGSTASTSSGSSSSDSSSSSDNADAADHAAMADLQTNSWVKDLYVSPGYMNIGVIRGEKDWSAPMIGQYACGVLRKHGSTLSRVRFVDIEAVASGSSLHQAEIYEFSCP